MKILNAIAIIWNDNSFQSNVICILLTLLIAILMLAFAKYITTDSPTLTDKIVYTILFTIFIILIANSLSPNIENHAKKIQNEQKLKDIK